MPPPPPHVAMVLEVHSPLGFPGLFWVPEVLLEKEVLSSHHPISLS